MVVGVGDEVHQQVIQRIASEPSNRFALKLQNFDELQDASTCVLRAMLDVSVYIRRARCLVDLRNYKPVEKLESIPGYELMIPGWQPKGSDVWHWNSENPLQYHGRAAWDGQSMPFYGTAERIRGEGSLQNGSEARSPLPNRPAPWRSGDNEGRKDTVFTYGPHKGRTFQYVKDNDKSYACWALSLEGDLLNSSGDNQMKQFVDFLNSSGSGNGFDSTVLQPIGLGDVITPVVTSEEARQGTSSAANPHRPITETRVRR